MNLLQGSNGTFVNLDNVRFMEPRSRQDKDGEWKHSVYVVFSDEATLTVPVYEDAEDTLWRLGSVIQANPGFEVVDYNRHWEGSDPLAKTTRTPVIAWRVTAYGPEAITPDDTEHRPFRSILFPNGEVCERGGASYDSLEAFAKAKCEEATRDEARERAA